MLSSSLLLFSVLSSTLLSGTHAIPHPSSLSSSNPTRTPIRIPLTRRATKSRTDIEWGEWAKSHRERLTAKYGGKVVQKRASGTNLLVNHGADSSYYGSIAIGTPATSYNVILDSGSADLWVASSECRTGCEGVTTFDGNSSSTFVNKNTQFSITYGSGATAGTLGQDVIQMAGFSVSDQIFAVCDQVSTDLLSAPASGLMGLGFTGISASGATPFWETLVSSGAWDQPVMAVQLTRFGDDASATDQEFGGSFTMGFLDSSLYTGDITYTTVVQPNGLQYWTIPIAGITVDGTSVGITLGTTSYAAIDTGTTLVGGPSTDIAAIYAQIPGSTPGTGNYDGYYQFPCSNKITVSITFGTTSWTMSSDDMTYAQISSTKCIGAFFTIDMGGSGPTWIVGDAFLKNVYTVFQYDPPAVGFAALSTSALAANNGADAVPSATIGSVSASATGGSTRSTTENSAVPLTLAGLSSLFCATVTLVFMLL